MEELAMVRTNVFALCVIFVACTLTFATRAEAQFISSGAFQFPQTEPPASLSWTIATNDGQSLTAMVDGIIPPLSIGQFSITELNAASYGVDFAAWEAALNNPAFTRSIVGWDGATQEGPIIRNGIEQIDLDRIRLEVDSYFGPESTVRSLTASARAIPVVIIPEPSSGLLIVCAAITFLTACSTGRR